MDLRALPEGVVEPLVSGAAFARQEQIRYTWPALGPFTLAVSVEDPSSNDVLSDDNPLTHTPDFTGAADWTLGSGNHLRLAALRRRIELSGNELTDDETSGWGVQASGRWTFGPTDSVLGGFSYGDGVGRYMLGLDPVSGGYVDPVSKQLKSRVAHGWFAGYRRILTDRLRANLMYGMAEADDDLQFELGPDAFKRSTYFAGNLFYEVTPYLMISGEYTWGERQNLDDNAIDSHRLTLGFQLY